MTQLIEGTAPAPAPNPVTGQVEGPRKHCWECLRRRLVCDSVRPVCNRCRKNGIVCPGYGEQQPLRWVKPGRVTVRNRRRPKAGSTTTAKRARVAKRTPDSTDDDPVVDGDAVDQSSSTTSDLSSSDGELQSQSVARQLFALSQPRAVDSIMRYDIWCENFAGIEASYIYNVEMYERSTPLKLLRHDGEFKMPLATIARILPAAIKGLFIIFALGHQMYKLPGDAEENVRDRARSAIAFWTCQVIRTLNEDIAEEETRASDGTMTGVLMLMLADQQIQASSRWRLHYSGLMKMVRMRGGVEKLWHERPHMHNTIQTWVLGEVFANTTSPSNDQLMVLTHPKRLAFTESTWATIPPVYIGSICPPPLFRAVIRINHLRALASRSVYNPNFPYSPPSSSSSSSSSSSPSPLPSDPSTPSPWSPSSPSSHHPPSSSSSSFTYSSEDDIPLYTDAPTLLAHILAFSPSSYVDAHGSQDAREYWLLVVRVYHSAVVLYCILSLRGLLLLPPESKDLERTVRAHYDRLLLDLKAGLRHEGFRNCLFWPLVVAGVCAARGTAFERAFIADALRDAVKDVGSSMLLLARKVLTVFWASGKTGWDDCFDQPYLFMA
ncbi:putative C6 zinc finger domain-containing protein [Rosellinia necatrix]|uniref:Putative C6 zinc finger domain-containing protein n=1 Tax=Rosellinia necatrix TaxID=77044 RepID=A0A1W2TUY7_ROSNE|nr:putative C6 zinc finger domain-containing protein [Rosellinia necatrix]